MRGLMPMKNSNIDSKRLIVTPLITIVCVCFALSPSAQAQDAAETDSNANSAMEGSSALSSLTTGIDNTATGVDALDSNTTGSSNIAVGKGAGKNLSTGDNNIDIGNTGVAAESNTIRIGDPTVQTATYIAGISGVTVPSAAPVVIDA